MSRTPGARNRPNYRLVPLRELNKYFKEDVMIPVKQEFAASLEFLSGTSIPEEVVEEEEIEPVEKVWQKFS